MTATLSTDSGTRLALSQVKFSGILTFLEPTLTVKTIYSATNFDDQSYGLVASIEGSLTDSSLVVA